MEKQYRLKQGKDRTGLWLVMALSFILLTSFLSLFASPKLEAERDVNNRNSPWNQIAEVAAVVG